MNSVTRQLVEIENDQRATRTNSKLNYGSLRTPSGSPRAYWSGDIRNSDHISDGTIAAKWRIKFVRTDGVNLPPPVDIAHDYSTQADMIEPVDESMFRLAAESSGSNYLTWLLTSPFGMGGIYNPNADKTRINLTIQAISPVPGNLTIERVYD